MYPSNDLIGEKRGIFWGRSEMKFFRAIFVSIMFLSYLMLAYGANPPSSYKQKLSCLQQEFFYTATDPLKDNQSLYVLSQQVRETLLDWQQNLGSEHYSVLSRIAQSLGSHSSNVLDLGQSLTHFFDLAQTNEGHTFFAVTIAHVVTTGIDTGMSEAEVVDAVFHECEKVKNTLTVQPKLFEEVRSGDRKIFKKRYLLALLLLLSFSGWQWKKGRDEAKAIKNLEKQIEKAGNAMPYPASLPHRAPNPQAHLTDSDDSEEVDNRWQNFCKRQSDQQKKEINKRIERLREEFQGQQKQAAGTTKIHELERILTQLQQTYERKMDVISNTLEQERLIRETISQHEQEKREQLEEQMTRSLREHQQQATALTSQLEQSLVEEMERVMRRFSDELEHQNERHEQEVTSLRTSLQEEQSARQEQVQNSADELEKKIDEKLKAFQEELKKAMVPGQPDANSLGGLHIAFEALKLAGTFGMGYLSHRREGRLIECYEVESKARMGN